MSISKYLHILTEAKKSVGLYRHPSASTEKGHAAVAATSRSRPSTKYSRRPTASSHHGSSSGRPGAYWKIDTKYVVLGCQLVQTLVVIWMQSPGYQYAAVHK